MHYSWRRHTTGSKGEAICWHGDSNEAAFAHKQKGNFYLILTGILSECTPLSNDKHQVDLSRRPGNSVVPTVSHLTTEMATEKAAAQNKISVPIKASLLC